MKLFNSVFYFVGLLVMLFDVENFFVNLIGINLFRVRLIGF